MPAEEIGLVLDGLAAPPGLEHLEELAVAGFLAHRHVIVKGVQELVDDARDLALRNHQVAAAERPVPVGGVRPQNVQDTFGDAAIVTRPDHGAEDNPAPPSCARSRMRSWLAGVGMSGYARAPRRACMVSTFQPTTASAAIEGLPQVFDPAAAAGVEAVVLFDLLGREPGQWTLVIKDNACRVFPGRTIEPTVTLTMDSDLWLAIARGEKSGRDAFMNGEYQVSGDLGFMMQFGKIFPVR
ncbi:MAG: SCP2 sterol-binding domain-containing protein [Deltaproteobacteria bacterium]|nr:MAG: SCP2 sterol-binding domain-containing protein [Deltaproteobacteria bacterium]